MVNGFSLKTKLIGVFITEIPTSKTKERQHMINVNEKLISVREGISVVCSFIKYTLTQYADDTRTV